MSRASRQRLCLFCVAAFGFLSACSLPLQLLPTATSRPQPTVAPKPAWQEIDKGLQWRKLIPGGDELAQLVVVRIDPQRYRFRAMYRPGEPLSLTGWRQLAPAASLIVNANFFDERHRALGLVVSDGMASGRAYSDRGGAFLIHDGQPAIVSYRAPSLLKAKGIEQAIQGFPLLVEGGEQTYFADGKGERTRRTIIGIDRGGQVLIMVAPFLGLSLADLSAWLPQTDLDIAAAFNLDGGGSTMMALPGADYFQPSLDRVPVVLAVYPRAGE